MGGTTLHFVGGGALTSETGWSSGGGGCSVYESAAGPQSGFAGYQQVGCGGKRATPDVSLDADPVSGVSVYDSTTFQQEQGWFTVGGTSVSSPMWAARSADSGQVVNAAYVYGASISFRDITSGNNGAPCLIGFDLCSGRGSWVTPPTITSFMPMSGPIGTTVTITGNSFRGATSISFGAISQPTFTVSSDGTSITANVPPGATTGTITIITAAGTTASSTLFTVGSDFSLSANPGSVTIAQSDAGTSTISTAVTTGSAQSLSLNASGQPAGTQVSFSPASLNSGASSTMTVSVSSTTTPGPYTSTVTATGTSATHTTTVGLTVSASSSIARISTAEAGNGSVLATSLATSTFRAVAGNLLVVVVRTSEVGAPAPTVSDTAGNSFVRFASVTTQNPSMFGFYAKNITGNSADSVTASFPDAATTRPERTPSPTGKDTFERGLTGSRPGTLARCLQPSSPPAQRPAFLDTLGEP